MKRDRNKVGLFLTLSMFLLLLLTACSQSSTAKVETPKTSSSIKTVTTESQTLTIVNATAKQDGQMIVVDTTMKNSIASAQVIKPDLFALTVNSTVLSPDASKSQIPEQIPANTTAQFNLEFNSNNLEGNDSLRLGYQPINQSDPEQFFAIGDLTI